VKSTDFTVQNQYFRSCGDGPEPGSHDRQFSKPIRLDYEVVTNLLREYNEKVRSLCCRIDGDIDGGSERLGVFWAIFNEDIGNKNGTYV